MPSLPVDHHPKVAYLFSRYPLLGQTFCDNEMLGLEDLGWDLAVGSIYPPLDSLRQTQLSQLRAPVLYAPPRPALEAIRLELEREGRWPAAMVARHLADYGASFKPELRALIAAYFATRFSQLGVTHLHVPFANRATHAALFIKEITGLPLSFTTHGQDFMVDLGSPQLLTEMCDAAAFVVAVCDYSQGLLQQHYQQLPDKIVRVYNGMDPASFAHLIPSRNHPHFQLLSVGRLIDFKGFHHLIDAVHLLRQDAVDARLTIIGEGPNEGQLRSQIDQLGLAPFISLPGPMPSERVFAHLETADAFALACIVDSKGASDLLPTVITEAMFARLPVVSTSVAGVPEMVEPGRTGFLVPPGQPQALADALKSLARDPLLRRQMGEAGFDRASLLFSREVTIPQLAGHFTSAAKLATSPPPPAPSPSPSPRAPQPIPWMIYDLALPGRVSWLAAEAPALANLGGTPIAQLDQVSRSTLAKISQIMPHIEPFPDAMVLEMEWRMDPAARHRLEALRMEAAGAADGTLFLAAARRATWLATHIARCPIQRPTLLVGAGTEESIVAWLAAHLTGLPYALVFDAAPARWGNPLLRHIASGALAVSDACPSRPTGAPDALRRQGTISITHRLGPIRIRRRLRPPRPAAQARLLASWLPLAQTTPV